jgi:hypothetical protein
VTLGEGSQSRLSGHSLNEQFRSHGPAGNLLSSFTRHASLGTRRRLVHEVI